MRASGVLLPISSLPSKYGIGCFSREAYEFVDFLISAGQKYWQILPLGPTAYGDSPYQSFSTFAGNPNYIDLEMLIRDGLLTQEEVASVDWGTQESYVDYDKINQSRTKILRKAFERYHLDQDREFAAFVQENGFWLEDYCLYMAIKDEQEGMGWNQWPEELRNRHPGALQTCRERLENAVSFYRFRQYLFHKQWSWLKNYANQNGIKIIGDLPIYVAFDSADTWANPLLFQFDERNEPVAVAGCPPDGVSADGQLWGNPLYSWEYHRATEYSWWLRRLSYSLSMYDVVRIDHFRGFDEYYSIPYGDETAKYGHWEKGPGIEFFHVIREKLGDVPVIAEDLGMISDSVRQMLRETGFPGMKVLQFAFDNTENSNYLPHNIDRNCVVYTGTHDNDTVRGWYETANEHDLWQARQYMNNEDHDMETSIWDMIRLAMSSVADLAIVPIQDYLCLGSAARINTPSTLGDNWKWRLKKNQISHEVVQKMRLLVRIYRR